MVEPIAPRCNAPWVSAVVESDGTLRPCFFHAPIGNISEESLAQALNGPLAVAFRKSLDVAQNPICRRCVCSLHLPEGDPAMTDDQRTHAIELLENSRTEFLDALENLTEEQWNFKPAPDCWSAAEIAEHIMLTENVLFAKIQQAIAAQPNPDWQTQTAGKSDFLERALINRQYKAQAPELILPKSRFTRAQILRQYEEARARALNFIRETTLPLNEHTAEHPFPRFSTLSAYQWVLYIPLHNQRHVQQIAEIKATAGYPTS
jgi:hypothetical protein